MTGHPIIDQALRGAVVRRRRIAAVRVALLGISVTLIWVLSAMLLDRVVHGGPSTRWATAAVAGGLGLATALRVVWLLWPRRFDAMPAARFVERIDPAWGERISTVVTQATLVPERRASTSLNAALAAEVGRELTERPPARRVATTAVKPAAGLLLCVLTGWTVVFALPSLEAGRLVGRQLKPWAKIPAVTTTRIEMLPHDDTIRQGDSLTVTVDVSQGDGPATLLVGPDTRRLKPVEMRPQYAGRFSTTLLSLQEDFVYRVAAGDAVTPSVAVRVTRVPGVVALDVKLLPPEGPPVDREASDGRLRVAVGTRMVVKVRATEPLRDMTFHFGPLVVRGEPDADATIWRAEAVADESFDWSIDMTSRPGVGGAGPAGMRVTVD